MLAAIIAYAVTRRYTAPAPQPVVEAPAAGPVGEMVLPGRIQARMTTSIPAPIDGIIVAFHADVGEEVHEGQLLAEIRNDGLQGAQESANTELESAQARVTNLESAVTAARLESSRASADAARARGESDRASRNYARQKMLVAEGATPRQVFEKAEKEAEVLDQESRNAVETAKQAEERLSMVLRELDTARKLLDGKVQDLESASARLDAGQIISPVDGVIAARKGQQGEQVHPATGDLFQIATDLSTLEVTLEPDPKQALVIKVGQPAAVIVADLPNESLQGKVTSAERGKVIVEFSNPSPLVKPGLTAQVRIKVT